MLQYAQDFDEKYMLYRADGGTGVPGNPYGWADAIQPYLKSAQVFQCPSDTTPPATVEPIAAQPGYTDYVYNVAIGSQPAATTSTGATGAGASLSSLEQVSLTMMLMDAKQNGTTAAGDNGSARNATRGSGGGGLAQANNFNAVRHLDGANLAFADGHVKWYKGQNNNTAFASVYRANASFAESGSNATMHPYDPPAGTQFWYADGRMTP